MDRRAADNEPALLYTPLSPTYEQLDSSGHPNPTLNPSPNLPPADEQDTALYAEACPDRDLATSNKPRPHPSPLNQEYEEVGVAMTSFDAVAYKNAPNSGEKKEAFRNKASRRPSRRVYKNAAAALGAERGTPQLVELKSVPQPSALEGGSVRRDSVAGLMMQWQALVGEKSVAAEPFQVRRGKVSN